ncbi:MAG: RNA-binding transcriptional accessory protein [Synechococcaceae cyanobacterium SM2_3_1]|nr:RNA-binding transcriptional accessory protein [Synechococcaceae cyanobacterium SM2_3_1]
MPDLIPLLAQELALSPHQIKNALDLFAEGATVPFVARYRKERTGEMNEVQLRQLQDRYTYLTELEDRKQSILSTLADQGKLTPELRSRITTSLQKTELEDLYLPFRKKRRTRASMARDKGLQPLADKIQSLNHPRARPVSLEAEAAHYLDPDQGVVTEAEALQGARDILAEMIAEDPDLRTELKKLMLRTGAIHSQIKKEHPEGSTQFEMYRNYQVSLARLAPHNLLALMRGQTEAVLKFSLVFDEDQALTLLYRRVIQSALPAIQAIYQTLLQDALTRLLKPSLTTTILAEKKDWADAESVKTFATNLRELLLAPPAGMKSTLGIDPGFRTGCKVAVLGETGQLLDYKTLYIHQSAQKRAEAAGILRSLIQKYTIALIAIGNGTASRETDLFVGEVLQSLSPQPLKVMVSEAGASVYSASPVAIAEFPDLDVTVRGAISIGRRVQDPLAELVKIDPQSIGVGQYQHDVDQKLLHRSLQTTVESCVNFVGVDLNTASQQLLTYVAGIGSSVAGNIITHRTQKGPFRSRQELLKVSKLGPKAFEQAAGFLRIRDGAHPLDNTAVHPESYGLVEKIVQDLQLNLKDMTRVAATLPQVDLQRYVQAGIGEPTLRDILQELEKPGRDPRKQFVYATFQAGINSIADLEIGMILEGVITNVVNFGAFVDIGVHQDGLVHISQLADRFVKDPLEVVKVGQVVRVKVIEVNEKLNRISLSMRQS